MFQIKNVKKIDNIIYNAFLPSEERGVFDTRGRLTLLPALIDPHVHFRTPGHEYKENWISASRAAIAGGVTTVFDMPNNHPSIVNGETVRNKIQLIESQLATSAIPLRYKLWLGADRNHFEAIAEPSEAVVGIKIYMGSSTGGLLMEDQDDLEKVFALAAQYDKIVAVHAEDEQLMQHRERHFSELTDPRTHSAIRSPEVARKAVERLLLLVEKYGTRLYLVHVSTKEELELIRSAKKKGLPVYAEVTPHHLHFTEEDYAVWGTSIQTNPPIRTQSDVDALWEAIADGTIDTVGSDHAPHLLEEKSRPYRQAPSGVPGVEWILPFLLNAYHNEKITLKRIVELTHSRPKEIFRLSHNSDVVLVDLECEKQVQDSDVKSLCGWSPYRGLNWKGWPKYTFLKGKMYAV